MKWVVKITDKLSELRIKIDDIDDQIINLILKRSNLVSEVGELKKNTGGRIYVPEREANIFFNLSKISSLPIEMVKAIYIEIISGCRRLEKILTIGILNDSKSLVGIKNIFGTYVENKKYMDMDSLFKDENNLDYILVKISEKSLELIETLNMYVINITSIDGEVYLLIGRVLNNPSYEDTTLFISDEPLGNNYMQFKNISLSFIPGHFTCKSIQELMSQLNTDGIHYYMLGSYPKI